MSKYYVVWGFFFIISIIRTKSENTGSRLDTCCWIFYKTIIKDYLICSYVICYCSEKEPLKLYKQLWLLGPVKNQILNNSLVSLVLQKAVCSSLIYTECILLTWLCLLEMLFFSFCHDNCASHYPSKDVGMLAFLKIWLASLPKIRYTFKTCLS